MAKHLLRYLNGNRSLGIMYKATNDTKDWSAWTDATWGTEDDRKSFQGQTIIWNGGAVTWSATRQKSTAQSSMEAEIMSASEGAKEIAWMEKIASDIGITLKNPPRLHIDNESAIELTRTTKLHKRAKHIEIRHFYIRDDMALQKRLKVQFTPSTEQIADIFTKQLPKDQFAKLTTKLGLAG
ncbi:hypothetical protein K3495_g8475 [Podosphaera aphanis]|nr:hypothetical protein K3495_g8475 [Podosphaera aphanis]